MKQTTTSICDEHIIYLENGTKMYGKSPPESNFYICCNNPNGAYWYAGQNILYTIDAELATLHDCVRCIIFRRDSNSCFSDFFSFVSEAGMSSDWNCSAEAFQRIISNSENRIPNLYEEMYVSDVQQIISAVQNLLIGVETSFIDYYRLISEINVQGFSESKTYICGGIPAVRVTTALGNYFTQIYSILDLLTKIEYEIENKHETFETYRRLKSNSILYGQKDELRINDRQGSLFVKDEFIAMIESIRNEIVHNGSWEAIPKVFVQLENNKPVGRFVYFPDMPNGRYARYKNRHHFFSEEKQVNQVLPEITMEFYKRLFITILYMKNPELTPEMADIIFQTEKSRWECN